MSTQTASALPTPADRPTADVVIYDGHCRFCRNQVTRLHRWDSRGCLAYLSLHDPQVAQDYPDLSHDELMERMYVVTRSGERHGGADAFRYLSRRLPRLYPLAPLMHLPGSLPLWHWLYRQVARQRYRWGRIEDCDNDACSLHLR